MKKIYRILICAGASLAALLLPVTGAYLLLVPVAALAGFMAAEWGAAYMMPVLIAGVAGFCHALFPLLPGVPAYEATAGDFCLVAAFVLEIVFCFIAMRRRIPHRWALLGYALIAGAGIYLSCCLDSILAGEPPYSGVVKYLQEIDAALSATDGMEQLYSASMQKNMGAIISMVPDTLMMFCVLQAELLGIALLMFGRMWYRIFRSKPREMARLSLWRLPSSMIWGALFFAAVCAAAHILKLSIAASLSWTLGLICASLFAVQGVAYLYFIYERMHASRAIKIATWGFAVLLPPYAAVFYSLLGIVEQLTHKRRMITAQEHQLLMERRMKSSLDEYEKYGYTRKSEPDETDKTNDDSNGGSQ